MLDHSEGSVKPVRLVRLPPPPSLPLTIGRKSGSRTRSVRACQVLRPRRVGQVLALALLDILPSTTIGVRISIKPALLMFAVALQENAHSHMTARASHCYAIGSYRL